MKNPLENFDSRKESYEKTEKKLASYEEKLDKATHPLGKLTTEKSSFPQVTENVFSNAIVSTLTPENWIKIPYYKVRIKSAEQKLQSIYEKDETAAHELNDKYVRLMQEAAETGDDSKVKDFEQSKLGMTEIAEKE